MFKLSAVFYAGTGKHNDKHPENEELKSKENAQFFYICLPIAILVSKSQVKFSLCSPILRLTLNCFTVCHLKFIEIQFSRIKTEKLLLLFRSSAAEKFLLFYYNIDNRSFICKFWTGEKNSLTGF